MATSVEEIQTIIGQAPRSKRYTIAEFIEYAEDHPDQWLELIRGEIVVVSQPDKKHQKHATRIVEIFADHTRQIRGLGCQFAGTTCYFEVAEELREKAQARGEKLQSNVCPDASISFRNYWDTGQIPPALLVVEVLSFSNIENLLRDTDTKPEIYAASEIPAYWIVDRRDESVTVYTNPIGGEYQSQIKCHGEDILPAPGLEFLQITPARIFEA